MAIDLSEIGDDQIGTVDIVRIRSDLALRYDPVTRMLVWVDGGAKSVRGDSARSGPDQLKRQKER